MCGALKWAWAGASAHSEAGQNIETSFSWKCEKNGIISRNIKKHLTTIQGGLNHGGHEFLLGVSLFLSISSPFFHIFNQKLFD